MKQRPTAQDQSIVLRWRNTGAELARIRRRELRESTPEMRLANADELLRMAADHAKPRRTSGFVELQKLLRKRYS
ncbi:MAG: hypothetical protein M3552_19770 [Planctomycetota bacterium]|nr:hypothetical protein [Planctomycetaceae bacterium]MDQ3332856.1 hypothetical protein [Planctomycetota bacterium]